jgi:hypothetical protein
MISGLGKEMVSAKIAPGAILIPRRGGKEQKFPIIFNNFSWLTFRLHVLRAATWI